MPVTVRKNPGGGYDIVEKASGKKKGHSSTKAKADASARAWNAASRKSKPRPK